MGPSRSERAKPPVKPPLQQTRKDDAKTDLDDLDDLLEDIGPKAPASKKNDDHFFEGGENEWGSDDFDRLLAQCYLLCFKDENQPVPMTIFKVSRGQFTRDLDSADFVDA